METLQLLPVCFLLLSTLLGSAQTAFEDLKCDENVTAEIGKDINITCVNNEKICDMTVKFCINKTLCPNSSDINTFKNITAADNGRIELKVNIASATLHISSVQISDQRMYHFFLLFKNGFKEKSVPLRVVDPIPSTSEGAVTETAIFENFKSEDTSSSTITLVLIFTLAFVFAVALFLLWTKKKGAIKLPWRNPPDVYHQTGFTDVSL